MTEELPPWVRRQRLQESRAREEKERHALKEALKASAIRAAHPAPNVRPKKKVRRLLLRIDPEPLSRGSPGLIDGALLIDGAWDSELGRQVSTGGLGLAKA